MFNQKTCIVLGAGASYCYEDGVANLPTQADILGRMPFGADTSSGSGFPDFVGTFGMKHSFALGEYLRRDFGFPENPDHANSKIDFWARIQEQGWNLESLYGYLQMNLPADQYGLLDDFQAIIRTAVSEPTDERGPELVCRHHKRLCEALEPGDFVVNFNWDSVMADAMLYGSHFWFPMTGFGLPVPFVLLKHGQKACDVNSLVSLLHVHGSVLLFESIDENVNYHLLYTGPKQYSPLTGLNQLHGIDPKEHIGETVGFPDSPELQEGEERLSRGFVFLDGRWYRPIFVPPSSHKPQYDDTYARGVRAALHSRLPYVQRLVVAGYSFPESDIDHLSRLFPMSIMLPGMEIIVVNPSNGDVAFQDRVRSVFPPQSSFDFSTSDFREYCARVEHRLSSIHW